jgi:flagellar hook-length control protein FliK
MKIESLPANSAASSATLAQPTAILPTDGSPIQTDGEAKLSAFAAIFQQLSQAPSTQTPPAQTPPSNPPTLPSLPAIPPATLPDDALPEVAAKHTSPNSPLPSDIELPEEPTPDPEEKPQKQPAPKCDSADIPAPLPTQPLDIKLPSPSQDQPIVQDAAPKSKPIRPEKISLPKLKESDESAPKEDKKPDPNIASIQIPQELTDDTPPPAQDTAPAPDRPKLDTPKPEFTLPQLHLAPKEFDPPAAAPPPPDQSFIQSNHPQILTAIHGQLLPNGGSMHIRLDPPELGALSVQIDVRDGIVTASFQTSNDEATRLLSHSLTQLRTTLESAGVSVDKLQVQQSPREQFNSNSHDREPGPRQQAYERSAHDDRQRREMLQRMWRRLTIGRDNLDLVA